MRVVSWLVHFYTASGFVLAFLAAQSAIDHDFRSAFLYLAAQVFVDATDGVMARAFRVSERLPWFSGSKLDDLVDYLTYVFVPALIVWRALLVVDPWSNIVPWAMLLSSGYGFSQTKAKTSDHFFTGFPSYWNIVAFYLYALRPVPGWASVALVVVPALLTFVPSRYLYPSQRGRLNLLTNVLGLPWLGLLAAVLWYLLPDPGRARWLAFVSLYYPAYYLLVSWAISVRLWREGRSRGKGA